MFAKGGQYLFSVTLLFELKYFEFSSGEGVQTPAPHRSPRMLFSLFVFSPGYGSQLFKYLLHICIL